MTPDNEPSVADLVEWARAAAADLKAMPIAKGLNACADHLTRLERRCAEMEKVLRRAVGYTVTPGGQCHCCWAMPDQPHDPGCWVGQALKLLPPERANEGESDGQ